MENWVTEIWTFLKTQGPTVTVLGVMAGSWIWTLRKDLANERENVKRKDLQLSEQAATFGQMTTLLEVIKDRIR
jgi:hypothetical protein